jgi:hypothetical protein
MVITRFVHSHYAQKCWNSAVTSPSSFHHICVTLRLQRLAHLADISTKINELNFSSQDMTITIISAREKLEAFLCKTVLEGMHWKHVRRFFNSEWFFEWTWESYKWWWSFRHKGIFTRSTSYSGKEFSTCDVRFAVVTKPIYVPSHTAKLIKQNDIRN